MQRIADPNDMGDPDVSTAPASPTTTETETGSAFTPAFLFVRVERGASAERSWTSGMAARTTHASALTASVSSRK